MTRIKSQIVDCTPTVTIKGPAFNLGTSLSMPKSIFRKLISANPVRKLTIIAIKPKFKHFPVQSDNPVILI